MVATVHRIIERLATRGDIDVDGTTIYNAKLCGQVSRNGRRYTDAAMSQGYQHYARKPVYINHPEPDKLGHDRSFHDWIGTIENPRFVPGDGIYGDIRLRRESPHYKAVVEAVKLFNGEFGLSHCADGSSRYESGLEVVDEISTVFSVDLVMDPATTNGVFESVRYSGPTQAEIDALAEKVKSFGAVAIEQMEMRFRAGERSIPPIYTKLFTDVANQLEAWIRKPESGFHNATQTANQGKQIIDALADAMSDPLYPGAVESVKASLTALNEFIHQLASGKTTFEPVDSTEVAESASPWKRDFLGRRCIRTPEDNSRAFARSIR